MTSAEKPSPWYTRLLTYKAGMSEYREVLAALAQTYYVTNEKRISGLLGGEPDLITIVPSKRGHTFERQPFRQALAVVGLGRRLQPVAEFVPGGEVRRREYNCEAFQVDKRLVASQRVLLLEDTWVTGATAVSVAGAILEAGAESVAVIALAREVDTQFWGNDHPYLREARRPYDPRAWPR